MWLFGTSVIGLLFSSQFVEISGGPENVFLNLNVSSSVKLRPVMEKLHCLRISSDSCNCLEACSSALLDIHSGFLVKLFVCSNNWMSIFSMFALFALTFTYLLFNYLKYRAIFTDFYLPLRHLKPGLQKTFISILCFLEVSALGLSQFLFLRFFRILID